jgi:hypothetical protein
MILQRADANVQLASHTVRHDNSRVSRTTDVVAMNPTHVRRLRELKIKEDSCDSNLPLAPTIDPKNWPKTIDALQDCFSSVLGETKAPLAHVIRDVAAATAEADDDPNNYDTPENEMISWVPHQDAAGLDLPTYVHDRSKVWQTRAEVCRDDKCWICAAKPFQQTRDGRVSQVPHQDAAGLDLLTYVHDRSKVWQTRAKVCRDDKCWIYAAKPFQQTRDGRGAFQALNTHCL